ncbi:hypothetical protein [Natronorarus salvus]|uniref:hypothetical protein n=1 Tax=Natronorarus salvus TaxID=3117733 RepID=UPI002F2619DA
METPALAGFVGQRRLDHALVIGAGVLAFWIGYFGAAVAFFGGIEALAPGTQIDGARRWAGVVGAMACWGAFACAFVLARGGPVLDATLYPILTTGLAPIVGRWLAFGPAPGELRAGVLDLSLSPLVDALLILLFGGSFFVTLLTLWASALGEEERAAWERENLPAEFYDEFVEV